MSDTNKEKLSKSDSLFKQTKKVLKTGVLRLMAPKVLIEGAQNLARQGAKDAENKGSLMDEETRETHKRGAQGADALDKMVETHFWAKLKVVSSKFISNFANGLNMLVSGLKGMETASLIRNAADYKIDDMKAGQDDKAASGDKSAAIHSKRLGYIQDSGYSEKAKESVALQYEQDDLQAQVNNLETNKSLRAPKAMKDKEVARLKELIAAKEGMITTLQDEIAAEKEAVANNAEFQASHTTEKADDLPPPPAGEGNGDYADKLGMSEEDMIKAWETAITATLKDPLEKIAAFMEAGSGAAPESTSGEMLEDDAVASADGGLAEAGSELAGAIESGEGDESAAEPAATDGTAKANADKTPEEIANENKDKLKLAEKHAADILLLSDKGRKVLAAKEKIFAIKKAVTSTATAVAKANELGWPAAIPAMAAAAATGAAQLATIKGQFHDGISKVPATGSYILEQGERVMDSRLNGDLKSFMGSQKTVNNSNQTNNPTINMKFGADTTEDTIFANRGAIEQIIRDAYEERLMISPI